MSSQKHLTKMGGFDYILALSQKHINHQIGKLFEFTGEIEENVCIKHESANASFKATLKEAPRIAITPAEKSNHIIFIFTFKGGSFQYLKQEASIPKLETIEIKEDEDWQIGFPVDITLADVQEGDDLPLDVAESKKKLKGLFSVRRLVMDFQNAKLMTSAWDPDHTQIPDIMDSDASDFFERYMREFFEEMQKQGCNILIYSMQTTKPDKSSLESHATFPPTDVTFSTNMYRPNGNEDEASEYEDFNTLNLQIMTQNRTRPKDSPPKDMRNWVESEDITRDPEEHWLGTMGISKRMFLDEFLLPKLSEAACFEIKLSNNPAKFGFNYNFKSKSGNHFKSTPLPKIDDKYGKFPGLDIIPAFDSYWKYEEEVKLNYVEKNMKVNFDVDVIMKEYVQLFLAPKIHSHPDENVDVYLTGSLETTINDRLGIWGDILIKNIKVWDTKIKWSITKNGKLYVEVEHKDYDPIVHQKETGLIEIAEVFISDIKKGIGEIASDISGEFERRFKRMKIGTAIESNLNSLVPFVFPGGRQFSMKNPAFNDELDLLLDMTYRF